jgi:hypothetical protein
MTYFAPVTEVAWGETRNAMSSATSAGFEAINALRRSQVEWESHGRIERFALGAHDGSDRLLIPKKLYGREREIETLLAAFDHVVANGILELVLVSS